MALIDITSADKAAACPTKDDNSRESIDPVTRATGLVEVFTTGYPRIGWQLQGDAFRLCVVPDLWVPKTYATRRYS